MGLSVHWYLSWISNPRASSSAYRYIYLAHSTQRTINSHDSEQINVLNKAGAVTENFTDTKLYSHLIKKELITLEESDSDQGKLLDLLLLSIILHISIQNIGCCVH